MVPPVEPVEPAAANPLADDIKALAIAAGLGDHAAAIAMDPQVTDLAAARAAIDAAKNIKAFAAIADRADLGDQLIRARKPVAEARATLAEAMRREDESTFIDTAPKSTPPAATQASKFSTVSLWDEIRAAKAGSKK